MSDQKPLYSNMEPGPRKRPNVFSGGDIFDEKTPEARPFTSPGEGTTTSKPIPSWLQEMTASKDEPESGMKRPASGALKPPLGPSRSQVDAGDRYRDDLSDLLGGGAADKKSLHATPPLGLANLTGDDDALSQAEMQHSRRPFSESNLQGGSSSGGGGVVAQRRAAQSAGRGGPSRTTNLNESPIGKVERLVS